MSADPIDLVNSLGYLGIFLLIFVFPVPPEVVSPLAGFIAAQGKLSLVYVVLSGVMGSIAASLPWYWAGRYIGERRLTVLAKRYRKWIKLSSSDIRKATYKFDRHGNKAIFISQFIPGLRTWIALPAGISRMNLGLFLLCLSSSAMLCQGLLACAGYFLGSRYELISQYTSPFSRIGVIILAIAAMIWFVKREKLVQK